MRRREKELITTLLEAMAEAEKFLNTICGWLSNQMDKDDCEAVIQNLRDARAEAGKR